jgi:hypothetical protein
MGEDGERTIIRGMPSRRSRRKDGKCIKNDT